MLTPSQPFRSSDGEAINGGDPIVIHLSDFASGEVDCGDISSAVYIPFPLLAEFLKSAEKIQRAREHPEGQSIRPSRRVAKHNLSSSPTEQLTPEYEAKIVAGEERAASLAAAGDTDLIISRVNSAPTAKRRLTVRSDRHPAQNDPPQG